MGVLNKFNLEEIYLVRTCNLKVPDKERILKELKTYLDLDGMEAIVRNVMGKIRKATEEELKALWEFPLD